MDEVSPSGSTRLWEVRDGRVATWTISPEDLGLACDDLDGLAGGEPAENAGRVERLLGGGGTMVERCAVLLNAAAALYVAGRGWTMTEAAARAREALEDGGAARALAELRRATPRAEVSGAVAAPAPPSATVSS
jgi:anthranilate phosphoribosyltransferase